MHVYTFIILVGNFLNTQVVYIHDCLSVIPNYFIYSVALAAGMMIAASFSLLYEGSQVTQINYGLLAKLEVGKEQ